jgi:hypothetical protein
VTKEVNMKIYEGYPAEDILILNRKVQKVTHLFFIALRTAPVRSGTSNL